MEDERLEQLKGNLLRQAALRHLQLRIDDDHRTPGVVHPSTEKVPPQAPVLAVDPLRERLERTVVPPTDRALFLLVVNEGIDRFLQHAPLVAQDDLRRAHVDQLLQPVIPVDDPSVQVVEIRGGKLATLELDHRSQVGREDGDDLQDHILGVVLRIPDLVDDLQALHQPALVPHRPLMLQFHAQLLMQLVEVNLLEQPLDPERTGSGNEPIRVDALIRPLLQEGNPLPHLPRERRVPYLGDQEDKAIEHLAVDRLTDDLLAVAIDEHVKRRLRAELTDWALSDLCTRLNLVPILDEQVHLADDRVLLRSDDDRLRSLSVGERALLHRHPPRFARHHGRGIIDEERLLNGEIVGAVQNIHFRRIERLTRAHLARLRSCDEIQGLFYRLGLIVGYPLELLLLHPQQSREEAGDTLQKPEMDHWASKRNVPHIDPSHGRIGHQDVALLAGYPLVLLPFVLPASTLIAVLRAEDLLRVQTAPFRAMRAVIYRLRFRDLAV